MAKRRNTNNRWRWAAAGAGIGFAARAALRFRARHEFSGEVVVITGGSRGLGIVLARQLANEGAKLALFARDSEELERAQKDVAEHGAEVLVVECDVRQQEAVEHAIQRVIDHYGRIDVLINNAGTIQVGPIEHMQIADYEDAMATNYWGALYAIDAVLPGMRAQGGGRIANISSVGGLVAVPHLVPYSASKHALVGLSNGLRAELAKDKIVVTTVCPGELRTGAPPNALFKGRHEEEYAWFASGDSVPVSAISAKRTAHQIIEAIRHGDGFVIVSIQARLLHLFNALAPNLFAFATDQAARRLPAPTGAAGDEIKTGWQSMGRESQLLTSFSNKATEENNGLKGRVSFDAPPPIDTATTNRGRLNERRERIQQQASRLNERRDFIQREAAKAVRKRLARARHDS